QLAQVHNSTTEEALKRFCGYFPGEWNLKNICFLMSDIFGPTIIKLMETKMNPDMVCYSVRLCQQQSGRPRCHLFPFPKVSLNWVSEKRSKLNLEKHNLCTVFVPILPSFVKSKLPYEDFDGDKFSTFPTLRGYYWRGRDCDDAEASVYPGKRPDNWDAKKDSNCNGIWGVDPKDGIPYEQKFCNGTDSKGIIVLGDSAAAYFHIPPEWITASKMSKKAFSNIFEGLTNELDWPQFSGTTGFLNSTAGGWTESFYLNLRRRNHCNHRDYQQLSKNGMLARSQQFDKPAIVIFAMIGNDVCNGKPNTVKYMTRPDEMRLNVIQTLRYLDSHLPKGSHVILTGLANGQFLWDNMHSRYHPLGKYRISFSVTDVNSEALTIDNCFRSDGLSECSYVMLDLFA
ncbi:hypothetical protein JRQ81_018958, partial [Phrynocephalus forsythii]